MEAAGLVETLVTIHHIKRRHISDDILKMEAAYSSSEPTTSISYHEDAGSILI
jgi:hypothetical protein